jgi:hypothetical protein
MKPRIEYAEVAPAGVAAMLGLENHVRQSGFDPALPSAQFLGDYAVTECSPRGESVSLMDEQKLPVRLFKSQIEARIDRGAYRVREEVIRPIATEPPPDFPSITDPSDFICQSHIQFAAIVDAMAIGVVVVIGQSRMNAAQEL